MAEQYNNYIALCLRDMSDWRDSYNTTEKREFWGIDLAKESHLES